MSLLMLNCYSSLLLVEQRWYLANVDSVCSYATFKAAAP